MRTATVITIPEEIIDAVQRANHYSLDDYHIRRILEPALEYLQQLAKGEKK